MASITKRGDFQWQAKVRVLGHPAKSKTFTLKADAERWGKETEIAIERGLFFDRSAAERTTVGWLIEKYRIDELPKKKGKHFKSSLNQIEAAFGKIALSSLSSQKIAEYRDLRLKLVSESSVKQVINLLSSIIDLAGKEWGIPIAANPCLMVKRPIEAKGRDRRFNDGEEVRLFEACELSEARHELVPIVRLALETGARQGELLKLQWKDVSLERCTARLLDTKNGEDRTIPLSSVAVAVLKSMPRNISGKVFGRWSGGEALNKAFKVACMRAGIEGLRFHDLRHEAVSRLFEKGLNPMEAAAVSGHKTLAMLKRYTHLKAEDLAKKLG